MLGGSFDEKIRVAARTGIQSVALVAGEFAQASDAELDRARRLLRAFNLGVDTIVAGSDWRATVTTARKLSARMVLVPADPGANTIDRLRRQGDLAAKAELTLLSTALGPVKEAGHEHVRLLLDVSAAHAQPGGGAVKALDEAGPYLKAIHVADSPGRGEPGSGAIPFDEFYRALVKLGFDGFVAMNYRLPAGAPGSAAVSLIRAVDAMRKSLAA